MSEGYERQNIPEQEAVEEADAVEHEHPRGTFLLLLIYLVIFIGIWGSVYLTLIRRG